MPAMMLARPRRPLCRALQAVVVGGAVVVAIVVVAIVVVAIVVGVMVESRHMLCIRGVVGW